MLEAELRRLGYPILPDSALPREKVEYIDEVTKLLAGCKLSIHLVGRLRSRAGLAREKSVTVIQNELAIQRCNALATTTARR